MVDEVLLEHEGPALDDVEQRLLEGLGVHAEPGVEDLRALDMLRLLVDLLVRVDLQGRHWIVSRGPVALNKVLVVEKYTTNIF